MDAIRDDVRYVFTLLGVIFLVLMAIALATYVQIVNSDARHMPYEMVVAAACTFIIPLLFYILIFPLRNVAMQLWHEENKQRVEDTLSEP